ncbi:MAG: uracil-DNA glycosylase family protein [Paracoccaceae bacterium]
MDARAGDRRHAHEPYPPTGSAAAASAAEDAAARGRPSGLDTATARLGREARACRLCAERFAATRTRHRPNPIFQLVARARVLVASQAPGNKAHQSGLPFDDPSGERLRDWMGLDKPRFYDPARVAIVPMGLCFPGYDAKGSDIAPPRICAETWRARLVGALQNLALTLEIGQYAQRWHLGPPPRGGVTARVRASAESGREDVMALPHPSWRNSAWLKRNPWFEADVVPRLRARIAALV